MNKDFGCAMDLTWAWPNCLISMPLNFFLLINLPYIAYFLKWYQRLNSAYFFTFKYRSSAACQCCCAKLGSLHLVLPQKAYTQSSTGLLAKQAFPWLSWACCYIFLSLCCKAGFLFLVQPLSPWFRLYLLRRSLQDMVKAVTGGILHRRRDWKPEKEQIICNSVLWYNKTSDSQPRLLLFGGDFVKKIWSKIITKVIFGDCLLAKREQFSSWSKISQAGCVEEVFWVMSEEIGLPSGHEADRHKPINNENPKRCLRLNCLLRMVCDMFSPRQWLVTVSSRMLVCPGQNCTLRAR